MKKISSLLDYSYPGLPTDIWQADGILLPYHKDFILKLLNSFYKSYDLKEPEQWAMDITVIGSLTTNKFLRSSDFDCHVLVDVNKFIETNMPKASKEEALERLDTARKEWDRAKVLMPFGQHPMELYFENPENPSNVELVGRYSVMQNKWLKEPISFPQDADYEESKRKVIEEAKVLANELDASFSEIDRSIKRIEELKEVAAAWPKEKRKLYQEKIQKKLDIIEDEIEKAIGIKDALVDERHAKQDPLSANEVKFKFLARFFYFAIIGDLKDILESEGEITQEELPLIERVINQAEQSNKFFKFGTFLKKANEDAKNHICVDFDDTIAHELPNFDIGEPMAGAKEGLAKLQELGYTVVIYSHRCDKEQGCKDVKEFLDKHDMPYDQIYAGKKPLAFRYIDDRAIAFTGNWSEAVQQVEKAEKKASLRIVTSLDSKYWLDPSGKEYKVEGSRSWQPVVGHLGWIEANRALLTQTYGFEFPSDYWEKSQGIDEIAETMIANGWTRITNEADNDFDAEVSDLMHLPNYLDNFIARHYTGNNIGIDDLDGNYVVVSDPFPSIQKQVNRTLQQKVTASLVKDAAYNHAYWIDPNGKIYEVRGASGNEDGPSTTHHKWIQQNVDMLRNEYGITPTKTQWGEELGTRELLNQGWVRIGDGFNSDWGITVQDINNIPTTVDNALAQFAPEGSQVTIEDNKWENAVLFQWPVKSVQNEVQRALRRRKEKPAFEPALASLSKKDITAQTKKVKQGDYGCLMAVVPHDIAQDVVAWGVRNIPDDALYLDEDGRLGRELETHVTIKYGLVDDDAKTARQLFNNEKPFNVKLGKVKHFEPPELPFDVVTIEVASEDLERMNKEVCDKLECAEGLPSDEYHPHITVAYVKRGTGKDFIGSTDFDNKEVVLDTVIFSPARGNRTYFHIDKEGNISTMWKMNKIAALDGKYWIAPDGKVFPTEGDDLHMTWVRLNLDLLEKYGINTRKFRLADKTDNIDALDDEERSLFTQMLNSGWTRITTDDQNSTLGDSGFGIGVKDITKLPSNLDNFIAQYADDGQEIYVEDRQQNVKLQYPFKSLQQAVNNALQQKRLQPVGSMNKKADLDRMWVDPSGQVYYTEGETHFSWISANLEMLERDYGFKVPKSIWEQRKDYYNAIEEQGDEDNIEPPEVSQIMYTMLDDGWVRIGDAEVTGVGIELHNLRKIPSFLDNILSQILMDGDKVFIEDPFGKSFVEVVYPFKSLQQAVNKALSSPAKTARNNFLPSLVQPADNNWTPDSDVEIPIDPDAQSDEMTNYAPCTTGKPRNPEVWRQVIPMLRQPLSKKDVEKESASDPEQEAIEKKELGEDETLLEYSKNFKDLNRQNSNKPKTTWPDNSSSQGGEPYAPLPSFHVETNPQNENWRFPYKFTRRPIGDDSNQNEVLEMLTHSALSKKEIQKKASVEEAWISPKGEIFDVGGNHHDEWIALNTDILQSYGYSADELNSLNHLNIEDMSSEDDDLLGYWFEKLIRDGWIRINEGSGKAQFVVHINDLTHIPPFVDSFIAEHFDPSDKRPIDIGTHERHVSVFDPFPSLQNAVLKALRNPSHTAKQASSNVIRMTSSAGLPFNVYKNPTPEQANNIFQKSTGKVLRYAGSEDSLFMWDAWFAIHSEVMGELGLLDEMWGDGAVFSAGQAEGVAMYFLKNKPKQKVAGGQSNSVPDYLMDEWKTDQIHDDVDSEPYVNHDQRDYPGGTHDSPENTDSGIGWPQDNQPYVVRIDQLQKPADRPFPPGLPDYQVTIFPTYPQDGGMEVTNLD